MDYLVVFGVVSVMPLPDTITWYRSNDGSAIFEGRTTDHWRVAYLVDGDRHVLLQQVGGLVSIPLTNCHDEIGRRRRPPTPDFSDYYLRRNAFIQECALELYLSAIHDGIEDTGSFYGVIQDEGEQRSIEYVWRGRQVVYTVAGNMWIYHRVGLIYSPVELVLDREHMSPVEPDVLSNLPTTVLEQIPNRDIGRPQSAPMQGYLNPFEEEPTNPEPNPETVQGVSPEVLIRKSRFERGWVI